jgi:hypothetical protein
LKVATLSFSLENISITVASLLDLGQALPRQQHPLELLIQQQQMPEQLGGRYRNAF